MSRSLEEIKEDLLGDSKSKYEDACSEIIEICRNHLDKLVEINHKYKEQYKEYSDYQTGRGWFDVDDVEKDYVYLHYSDTWAFGGSCYETMKFNFNDLNNFDYDSYELSVKNKKIAKLLDNKKGLINQIKRINEELKNYQ